MINGNIVGFCSEPLTTVLLTDENGREILGVVVDELNILTATADDIAQGKTAATDSGIVTGTHRCE